MHFPNVLKSSEVHKQKSKENEKMEFSLEVKCLKLIGLQRYQLQNFFIIKFLLYLVMAAPVTIGVSTVGNYVYENYKDLIASAEASGIIFTGVIAMSKFAAFCCYKEKFFKIMDDIKSCSKNGIFLSGAVVQRHELSVIFNQKLLESHDVTSKQRLTVD